MCPQEVRPTFLMAAGGWAEAGAGEPGRQQVLGACSEAWGREEVGGGGWGFAWGVPPSGTVATLEGGRDALASLLGGGYQGECIC